MCNKVNARKRSLCEMIGWLLSERSYQPSTGEVEVAKNSRKKTFFPENPVLTCYICEYIHIITYIFLKSKNKSVEYSFYKQIY